MKKKALRAYTLLELMMGIFLVFCAAGYLLGTYAFGARASLSTDRFTAAVNLGQAKMEELQNCPSAHLLTEQKGKFPYPHQDYYWHIKVSAFSKDFSLLTVRTGQNGAPLCTLRRLINTASYTSIDAHIYDSETIFTDNSSKLPFAKVSFWEPFATTPKTVGAAVNWPTGAICGHPGLGIVWASHSQQPKIMQMLFNAEGKNIACKTIEVPANNQGYRAHIIDLAADKMGNFLFCADSANRALWVLDDSGSSGGDYSWKDGLCLVSKQKPIQDLRGIACDQYGSTIWLCEGAPRRLRQFYWGKMPKEGVQEKINSFSGWGEIVDVPFSGAGRLQSVAVNSWGSAVYTIDNSFVYTLIFQENGDCGIWQQIPMSEALRKAQPRALWIDPGNSRLYINTLAGGQWAAAPSIDGTLKSSSFSRINWR